MLRAVSWRDSLQTIDQLFATFDRSLGSGAPSMRADLRQIDAQVLCSQGPDLRLKGLLVPE